MAGKIEKGPVILLIENEEADVFLFRRALASLGFSGIVRLVVSAGDARNYLEGHHRFADRSYYPLPDLIVSDMNLSGNTGNDFLQWLRADERFKHLPFVFLSGSFLAPDKERAHQLGTDDFVTKTGDIQILRARVANILKFLPPDPPSEPEPPASESVEQQEPRVE